MSLRRFVDDLDVDGDTRSLVLVNRSAPEAVRGMVDDLFDGQPVAVSDIDLEAYDEDVVLLVEDDEVTASSPLGAVQDSLLFVNSDLYITGTRSLDELDVPAVLQDLDDVPFTLRGYPESNTEKLLLVLLSRFIEREAVQAQEGTLRVAFQRLSRLADERGTRAVYERLADTDVDVHLYGVPDRLPPRELEAVTHGGHSEDFTDAWFVVFEPPASNGAADEELEPACLLCIEVEPRTWEGFLTYDRSRIDAISSYIRSRM